MSTRLASVWTFAHGYFHPVPTRRRLSLGIVLAHGGALHLPERGRTGGHRGGGDAIFWRRGRLFCSLAKRMSAEGAGRVIRRSQGSMTAVGRLPTASHENSVAASGPGAASSMGNRRGRASTAGSDWKQSFRFFRPPAATDPLLSFDPLEVERQVTEYSRPSVRFFTDSSSATAAVAGSVFVGRQSGGKLPLIGNRAGRSLTGEPTHSTSTAIGSILKVGRQCDGYLPLV